MKLDELLRAVVARAADPCLLVGDRTHSYADIERLRKDWLRTLAARSIPPGSVVGVKADYGALSVSLLLALFSHRCIAALVPSSAPDNRSHIGGARIEWLVSLTPEDGIEWSGPYRHESHPLLESLRDASEPGFVIFSSGTTGPPKAVLHSAARFLSKFALDGKRLRTLGFLLFDHIAGMDTLCYTLGSGGSLVVAERRDPRSVCQLIEKHRVEVLPASPTFLNLLCLSGEAETFDLCSVKIVTYGSEPMRQKTLERVGDLLPAARIIQKYGTSEFGSPRAVSRSHDSLWMRVKTDETEIRVQDGLLWVRSPCAMLGYLNAPSIIDQGGWLCTGDRVEQDGEWIRVLGRASDLITVGGEKVYPQEVESAILELDCVLEAAVSGEPHPITGAIVTVRVVLRDGESPDLARKAIRRHCRARLALYKVPVKISFTAGSLATERHKTARGRY